MYEELTATSSSSSSPGRPKMGGYSNLRKLHTNMKAVGNITIGTECRWNVCQRNLGQVYNCPFHKLHDIQTGTS